MQHCDTAPGNRLAFAKDRLLCSVFSKQEYYLTSLPPKGAYRPKKFYCSPMFKKQ